MSRYHKVSDQNGFQGYGASLALQNNQSINSSTSQAAPNYLYKGRSDNTVASISNNNSQMKINQSQIGPFRDNIARANTPKNTL